MLASVQSEQQQARARNAGRLTGRALFPLSLSSDLSASWLRFFTFSALERDSALLLRGSCPEERRGDRLAPARPPRPERAVRLVPPPLPSLAACRARFSCFPCYALFSLYKPALQNAEQAEGRSGLLLVPFLPHRFALASQGSDDFSFSRCRRHTCSLQTLFRTYRRAT